MPATGGVTSPVAYASSPLWVPSRASFMTGRNPHHTCVWDDASLWPRQMTRWAHALGDSGNRADRPQGAGSSVQCRWRGGMMLTDVPGASRVREDRMHGSAAASWRRTHA